MDCERLKSDTFSYSLAKESTQCDWPCKGSFKDKSPQWWLPRIVDHMSSQKEERKSIASSLYMDDVNGIKHAVSQKLLFSTWDYRRCDIYLLVFLVHWPFDILNEPTTSEIPLLHGTWPATLSWSEIWTLKLYWKWKCRKSTLSIRRYIPNIQGLWHKKINCYPGKMDLHFTSSLETFSLPHSDMNL